MCVSVSNRALPAAGEGLWTSGVPMSRCWDLGRLGSREQVLPKASCWTDTHGTNIHMYTYIYLLLMDLPPDQPERGKDEPAEAVYACVSAHWPVCADLCVQLSISGFYVCVSLCVPTGNPCPARECGAVTASPIRSLDFTHKHRDSNLHLFYFRNGTRSKKLAFLCEFPLNHYYLC